LKTTPESREIRPKGFNSSFFKKLKKSDGKGNTALIVMNDSLAVDIVDEAAEHGIRFGKGIALLSFDDNTEFRPYELTTIAPSFDKIGGHLAKMVIDKMEKEASSDKIICMKVNSTLITRRTA
jgi:DNA-binding LacI/PurR family transcriptional regulator